VREGYVDFAVADFDLFDQGFDDFAFVRRGHGRPVFVKRSGLVEHVVRQEPVHLQEINLGFEFGQFGLQLRHPFLGGGVEVAQAVPGNLLVEVKLVGLVHGFPDLGHFPPVGIKQGRFFC